MPSESHTLPQAPQAQAVELFLHGHVIQASACLSEAISRGESADLRNDRAVDQLSLAEQAFRRALELAPSNADASTNLGLLLFTRGRQQEASVLLKQSLAGSTGPALAQIQTLLRLCSTNVITTNSPDAPCPNKLDCSQGKTPLLQRGQKVGRPRGNQFHQRPRNWRPHHRQHLAWHRGHRHQSHRLL